MLMLRVMHQNRRRPMHTADIAHLVRVKHAIRSPTGLMMVHLGGMGVRIPRVERQLRPAAAKEHAAVVVVRRPAVGGGGGGHAVGGRVAEAAAAVEGVGGSRESVVLLVLLWLLREGVEVGEAVGQEGHRVRGGGVDGGGDRAWGGGGELLLRLLLILVVLLLLGRVQHHDALDLAALAAALDALVGEVVHIGEVLRHLNVLGREHALVDRVSELGVKGLDFLDVVLILVVLRLLVSCGRRRAVRKSGVP